MRRLLPLIGCLMLVFTLWTGAAAHAAEIGGCIEIALDEGGLHSDGDGDQVPADADRGLPHHHGSCHGHHVGVPVDAALAARGIAARAPRVPAVAAALAAADADTEFRPPIA